MMPCVSGSSLNSLIASMKLVPMIGSPPMPMQVDWPSLAPRELADSFVGQGSAAGHDADVAFKMDMSRHDSDLALARAK